MQRFAYAALVAVALVSSTAFPAIAQQPATAQPVTPAPPSAPAPPPPPLATKDYIIGIGDVLHIVVWGNKELEQDIVVRPDGRISFPLAGEMDAKGLTVPQLTEKITAKLSDAVKGPNVSIIVKEVKSFRVFVLGEVKKPGVYPIDASTPVLEALTLAGSTTDGADLPAAYVIRGAQKIPGALRELIQG